MLIIFAFGCHLENIQIGECPRSNGDKYFPQFVLVCYSSSIHCVQRDSRNISLEYVLMNRPSFSPKYMVIQYYWNRVLKQFNGKIQELWLKNQNYPQNPNFDINRQIIGMGKYRKNIILQQYTAVNYFKITLDSKWVI